MGDAFSLFASLDDYYPGSRQKRRVLQDSTGPSHVEKNPTSWDSNPVTKTLYGEQVEMFTIGALAKAIGKAEGTIRSYQAAGYLPQTPYRLPTRMVNGSPRLGRRLFTRPMIEAAIEAFKKRGLLGAKRVEWGEHADLSREIQEEWARLHSSRTFNTNATNA